MRDEKQSEPFPYVLAKELESHFDLNSYDFGARMFDMDKPFWRQIDELAEKHYDMSPYAYCANNPVRYNDPDGRNAAQVVDDKNKTITVTAVYYVQTKQSFKDDPVIGYSEKDLKYLNNLDDKLNKKDYSVSEGKYEGYKVKFDLQFKDGGTLIDAKESAQKEVLGDVPIGNSFTKGDGTKIGTFFPQIHDDGQTTTVGGLTDKHKDVTMNSQTDDYSHKVHEMFHTFFFDHDNALDGIGTYYKEGSVNQNDINLLINNPELPQISKP